MNLICPVALKRRRFVLALAATAMGIFAFTDAARGQAPPTSARQTDAPQSTTPKASSAASSSALSAGRVIYAELTQTIEARKAKIGEPIAAKVTLAVLSRGKVLIADGAKISGHVTEAKRRSKKNPESVLGIVFDRAELKEGGELRLALTVQAVGAGGFSTVGAPGATRIDTNGQYSGVTALPGVPGHPTGSAMTPAAAEIPEAVRQPALDLGSKGVIGLSDLNLQEGIDQRGSLVTSITKDVKLSHGDELVLRVIAPRTAGAGTK